MTDQNSYAGSKKKLWEKVQKLKDAKRFPEALEVAKQVYEMAPDDAKIICGTADLFKRTKQSKRARKLYGLIAETDVIAANGMAQCFLLEKKYARAEEYYLKNAAIDKVAANGLAFSYQIQGKYKEAEDAYLASYHMNISNDKNIPGDKYAACGLAFTFLVQGKYPEAKEWYGKHAGDNAISANGVANVHMLQGQYDRAEYWYKRNATTNGVAANGLTQAYLLQDKYTLAENVIALNELKSNNPLTYYMGAITALKLGDKEKARQRVMYMAERCQFNKDQQPMLKLITEAGLLEEPIYAMLLMEENLQPEPITKKTMPTILSEFKTNLTVACHRSILPPRPLVT